MGVSTAAHWVPWGSVHPPRLCAPRGKQGHPTHITAALTRAGLKAPGSSSPSASACGELTGQHRGHGFEQENRIRQQTIRQSRHRCAQRSQDLVTEGTLVCFLMPSLNKAFVLRVLPGSRQSQMHMVMDEREDDAKSVMRWRGERG